MLILRAAVTVEYSRQQHTTRERLGSQQQPGNDDEGRDEKMIRNIEVGKLNLRVETAPLGVAVRRPVNGNFKFK